MTAAETSRAWESIAALRAVRAESLLKFASLDPARLEEERDWRGAPSNLRFRLSWLAEGSEGRRIRILALRKKLGGADLTEAQQAVIVESAEHGRLLGVLVGVPDALFELPPAPGEWSVRQILGHVIATDERYRIAVQHALDRARRGGEGPLRPPESELPARTGEAQSVGTPDEILRRMQTGHDAKIATLAAIPDSRLTAPTGWVVWDVDVRFRLHRFAAHDREHTIQLRKTFQALGFLPSEPQMLLADAQTALSALEATLASIDGESFDRQPSEGGPTISQLVTEILDDERGI